MSAAQVPVSVDQGWKHLGGGVEVRKVADGVYMLRHGQDGTAVAITEAQLALILKKRDQN